MLISWGGCKNSKRPASGFIFAIKKNSVHQQFRKTSAVLLLPGRSIVNAHSQCSKAVVWTKQLKFEVVGQQAWILVSLWTRPFTTLTVQLYFQFQTAAFRGTAQKILDFTFISWKCWFFQILFSTLLFVLKIKWPMGISCLQQDYFYSRWILRLCSTTT